MKLNGYLSASGCVWFWPCPFLQKNSVSCDISIFEITGASDSLKFSESASENFWFWLFQKHQRTAGSGFQENFRNQRTAGSGHFRNLEELAVFMKELVVRKVFFRFFGT